MSMTGPWYRSLLGCVLLAWLAQAGAAAGALSERAEAVREAWQQALMAPDSFLRMDGELQVSEHADGTLHLLMPAVTLRDPSAPQDDPDTLLLEVGTVAAILQPVAHQRWMTTWEIPQQMVLRDREGGQQGLLDIDQRAFSGIWAADWKSMLTADLDFRGMVLDLGAGTMQVGVDDGDRDLPGRVLADRLVLRLDLVESEPGVVSGPLAAALEGLLLEDRTGNAIAGLGALRLGVDYREVDLAAIAALGELAANPEALAERDPGAMLAEVLTALGGVETRVELDDLAADQAEGGGWLRLQSAQLVTGFAPSGAGTLQRDLSVSLRGRGLSLEAAEGAQGLDSFGLDLRLDRIAPATLFDLGLLSLMSESLPGAERVGRSQEILGGLDLGLSFQGIRGWTTGADGEALPYGLDQLDFGLGLAELDSPTPGLSLRYRHQGIAALPDGLVPVPDEFVPRELVVDIAATRLPLAGLLDGAPGAEALGIDPGDVFVAVLENGTRLDLHAIVIDLPVAGLRLNGHLQAGDPEGIEAGVIRGRAELEVRNLDTLVEYALAFSTREEQRQQIIGVAAILKLAAEQRAGADGEPVHYLLVEGSSLGELLINGTDLAPLLMGGP